MRKIYWKPCTQRLSQNKRSIFYQSNSATIGVWSLGLSASRGTLYQLSSPSLQVPGRAHRATEHASGGRVIDDLFCSRIPADLSPEHHSNIAQMCGDCRAMADPHRTDGLCLCLDAVEKIPPVTLTMVTSWLR